MTSSVEELLQHEYVMVLVRVDIPCPRAARPASPQTRFLLGFEHVWDREHS